MSALPIAIALLLGAQNAAPTADRSGEPAFRAFVRQLWKGKNLHFAAARWTKESLDAVFVPDQFWDLRWFHTNVFRLEYSDYWGGSALFCSDGQQFWTKPGEEAFKPGKSSPTLWESSPQLRSDGGYESPLGLLLQDEDRVMKHFKPENRILRTADGFLFESPTFGTVQMNLRKVGSMEVPWMFRYDNRPVYEAQYKRFPEWFPAPGGQAFQLDVRVEPLSRRERRIPTLP